jgi:hypothetical protein
MYTTDPGTLPCTCNPSLGLGPPLRAGLSPPSPRKGCSPAEGFVPRQKGSFPGQRPPASGFRPDAFGLWPSAWRPKASGLEGFGLGLGCTGHGFCMARVAQGIVFGWFWVAQGMVLGGFGLHRALFLNGFGLRRV